MIPASLPHHDYCCYFSLFCRRSKLHFFINGSQDNSTPLHLQIPSPTLISTPTPLSPMKQEPQPPRTPPRSNTPARKPSAAFLSPTASSRARSSPVRRNAPTTQTPLRPPFTLIGSPVRRRCDVDEEKEGLRRRVAELEGVVAGLRREVEVAQRLNEDLLAVNGKLRKELGLARGHGCRPRKMDQWIMEQKILTPENQQFAPTAQHPPPPPPPAKLPPPPPALPAKLPPPPGVSSHRSLLKQENRHKPITSPSAQDNVVLELKNRSAHFLAIKGDVATKGGLIKCVIREVEDAAYTDITDVVYFVDWLDDQLSTLADERAVLKHFEWPERKADAMREAATEYRNLNSLMHDVSSCEDDPSVPRRVAFKKLANLLENSEQCVQRVTKLQSNARHSFQKYKIPMDWTLDSGLLGSLKQASMKLANVYLQRVLKELEPPQNSNVESTQEDLMLRGLHFARRTYQLAGGLDSETARAFEEIRQRANEHLGGSGEALFGVPYM